MLTKEQGEKLLKLARESIKNYFEGKKTNIGPYKEFNAKQGVFVTLTINSNLRGCIGYPEPIMPLNKAVADAARSAAFNDPRFPSLEKHEFNKIKIEISVLTVPEEIKVKDYSGYMKEIKIGEDGLIMRSEWGSGLLLPQVFTEYDCDVKKALEMTCQKAGLEPNAWHDLDNKVYKFQAQIFSEE